MHLLCEPRSLLPVSLGVEFVTVQELLADEAACRAVWDLVGSQFRTRSKFLAIWPGVRHVALCRDTDGSVAGFVLVTEPVNWQLDYVVVRDDARGRGVASALVRTALNEACRRHVPYVMLSCDDALRPLYEGCGFRVVAAGPS
jgi:ribosomal protein S18 acetylase RimI-like enzyme